MNASLGISLASGLLAGDNLVSGLDKVLSTCLWLLPNRFTSHELAAEACQSVLGVMRLCSDGITHFREDGVDPAFTWATVIKLIRQLEVLYEMRASHLATLGKSNLYNSMAGLEMLKLFARVFLFSSSDLALTTLLPADKAAEPLMEYGRNSDCVLGAFRSLSDSKRSLIASSWNSTDDMADPLARNSSSCTLTGEDANNDENAGTTAEFMPWWEKRLSPEETESEEHERPKRDDSEFRYKTGQTMLLIGEMLYLIRPIICVFALRKFGTHSWKPWLISLGIDVCSRFLLSKGESTMKYAGVKRAGTKQTIQDQLLSYLTMVRNFQWNPVEQREMKRRKALFLIYLLRSPLFEVIAKYGLNTTRQAVSNLPLLGQTLSKALELLYGVQRYYVYTSGSW